MATMWQGQTKFFAIADEHASLFHDSLARFWRPPCCCRRSHNKPCGNEFAQVSDSSLSYLLYDIMGGLARFTMGRIDIIFGEAIIASLLAEMLLMPILSIWLFRLVRKN